MEGGGSGGGQWRGGAVEGEVGRRGGSGGGGGSGGRGREEGEEVAHFLKVPPPPLHTVVNRMLLPFLAKVGAIVTSTHTGGSSGTVFSNFLSVDGCVVVP